MSLRPFQKKQYWEKKRRDNESEVKKKKAWGQSEKKKGYEKRVREMCKEKQNKTTKNSEFILDFLAEAIL